MARPVRDPSGITTKEKIDAVAMALFEARDFDQVTVDEIASGAGVTQRTVFRYFPNKAAMVLDPIAFSYFVTLPPTAPSLHAAIWSALAELAERIEAKRETVVRHAQLLTSSPTLRAAARGLGVEAMTELRKDLARYLDESPSSTRAYVLTEMVYAIGFAARHRWFEDQSVPVAEVMADSLKAVGDYFLSASEPA